MEAKELCLEASGLRNMDRLSKSDPFVVVSVSEPKDPDFIEFGRTETVWDDLNPRFVTKFDLQLVPKGSMFEISFYDRDTASHRVTKHDFLGKCRFLLDEVRKRLA